MNALLPLLLTLAAVDPRVVEAQQLAAHGETAVARDQYEAILDDLARSGAEGSAQLHYNLGTLALVDDDIGAAMLHLLAARRRDPGNDDVAYNLVRAREARVDRVEASSSTSLAGLGEALPPAGVRWLAGAGLALLGVVLVLRGALGARLPGVVVGVTLAFALVGGGLRQWRALAEQRVVVVVQGDTSARSSPDEKASGFDVHAGLTGERVEEKPGWWRVRLENGLDVWLSSSALAPVP